MGDEVGFPSVLNKTVRSLKTDHLIAVHPSPNCVDRYGVSLGTGLYPDLTSFLRDQQPMFKTVMKSFFMFPFEEDNIQLFSKWNFLPVTKQRL